MNPGGSAGDPRLSRLLSIKSLDGLTGIYERNFGYSASINRFFRRFVKNRIVADLGCGHGLSTFYNSTVAKRIVGFDVDRDAISYACRLKESWKSSNNVDFVWRDSYETGLDSNHFDAVLSADVIEHVNDPMPYLLEACRICKEGGTLLISTPNGLVADGNIWVMRAHSPFHVAEYSPLQLERLLKKAGFHVTGVFEQGPASRDPLSSDPLSRIKRHVKQSKIGLVLSYNTRRLQVRRVNTRNSLADWEIHQSNLQDITATSCTAFIMIAEKSAREKVQGQ